jgi:hypothetical protein
MSWHNASTHKIEKIIRSLKSKSTGGYDEISTRIPKLSTPYIIYPLTYICNAILNTGTFSDRLKYAIIKPIFKKGNDQNINNYRPISLLTSFSKVIEKLIYARLLDHITTNSILVNEQNGFRTRYSTELATFSLINNILTAINNNLKIGGIFCDLQKAFDFVNHEILLNKLEFYGIEGKFKTLIESYLTGRYQKVTLNANTTTNRSSKWELINNSVPQCSILHPLFFLFYINDLPKVITKNNSIVLFADDTSLLITDSNTLDFNTNINQSPHNIICWFNSNLLVLNFNKTHCVEFRTENYYEVKTKVTYDHINITNSTETKFWELIIDETLSWNQHVDQIASKLCSAAMP